MLALPHDEVQDNAQMWEYTVLVTDVKYDLAAIGQLYRDRADCENGFDELKNQWGLSGFTTQDIKRCQTTARSCALVYNWWSWYCRTANPSARMEAITSRPLLLAAVGRATHSGGQTTLHLMPLHGKARQLKRKRSANPIFPANTEPANLVSIATTKRAKWNWIGKGWSGAWSRWWPIGRRA